MNVMMIVLGVSSVIFVSIWLIFSDIRTMLLSLLAGLALFSSLELGKIALQFCFGLNTTYAYFFSSFSLAFLGWLCIRKQWLYDFPEPQPCIEHTPLRLDLAHDLTIQEK